jgi:parallel beta-helix repeat protein
MPENIRDNRQRFFDLPGYADRSPGPIGTGSFAPLLLAIGLGALAVLVSNSQSIYVRLAVPAVLAAGTLWFCVRATISNPLWIGCALALTETLPYLTLIPADPESRWWLHYPMLLAFSLPLMPLVWRSGILKKGCFRGFLFYFGWAAISVLYSLDPVISAGRLVPAVLIFAALAGAVASVRDDADIREILIKFMIGCSVIVALNVLVAVAYPPRIFIEGQDPVGGVFPWVMDPSGILRFAGVFDNPNYIGALMMAMVGVGIVLYRHLKVMQRVTLLIVLATALALSALADSRSPFGALAVGTTGFLIWRYRFRGAVICIAIAAVAFIGYASLGAASRTHFNRNLDTLTGRTVAWHFEVRKIDQRPLTGFGYMIEGGIFKDPHFSDWDRFWNRGPNTSLHEGYLSVAVGTGIPALVLWLFLALRPWIAALARKEDPWDLVPIFFFIVVPMLLLGLDESGIADPRSIRGVLFYLCWMLAERQRLASNTTEATEAEGRRRDFARILAPGAAGILLLGLASVMCVASTASAANYYVDATNGNDAASGTSPSAAWRTLSKVDHFHFNHGDVVRLKAGSVWRETLRPQDRGGRNFQGITITSFGSGDPPTIKGSDIVSGWRLIGGAVYAAPESKPVFEVYMDGGPGFGLLHACCTDSRSCSPSPHRPMIKGQTCWIGPMREGSWHWSNSHAVAPETPNTLYVWLPGGASAPSHRIEAVTRRFGIEGYARANELDGLVIDGLRIEQTGLRAISLQSHDSAGCCGSRGIGPGRGITGLVVRNCIVSSTGTGTFDDGSYGNAITIINATAPLVEGNTVSFAGNHGNCINVQNSNGARIIGNNVSRWNHNGIDIKGSRDVTVADNVAHDEPAIGAGFYTEYSRNVVFRDNRTSNVSNGFQISVSASASVLENRIQSAATAVYFGPRALSLTLTGNQGRDCRKPIAGDGRGVLTQNGNVWD